MPNKFEFPAADIQSKQRKPSTTNQHEAQIKIFVNSTEIIWRSKIKGPLNPILILRFEIFSNSQKRATTEAKPYF